MSRERHERESKERDRIQRIEVNTRNSGIEGKLLAYTWDSLKAHPKYEASKKAIAPAIKACRAFIANWPNVRGMVLASPTNGSFKTGLACIVANELLRQVVKVQFYLVADLLDQIRRTYNHTEEDESEIIDSLSTAPLLILDDLGGERIMTDERGDWAREKLFMIVNRRDIHERPIIATTNFNIESLGRHLSGNQDTNRILSRIMGNCDWIDIPLTEDCRL